MMMAVMTVMMVMMVMVIVMVVIVDAKTASHGEEEEDVCGRRGGGCTCACYAAAAAAVRVVVASAAADWERSTILSGTTNHPFTRERREHTPTRGAKRGRWGWGGGCKLRLCTEWRQKRCLGETNLFVCISFLSGGGRARNRNWAQRRRCRETDRTDLRRVRKIGHAKTLKSFFPIRVCSWCVVRPISQVDPCRISDNAPSLMHACLEESRVITEMQFHRANLFIYNVEYLQTTGIYR